MPQHEKERLSDIKVLTLYADRLTTARRTQPLPQLSCVGPACNLFTPDVVQCFNVGGSGTDVHWKCEADLPASLRFGRVDVSCEGWSRSGDDKVLKGSCALEYRLVHRPILAEDKEYNTLRRSQSSGWASTIFFGISLGLGLFVLYLLLKACWENPRRPSSDPRRRTTNRGPWGGWSSWPWYQPPRPPRPDNNNNPPPPPPYSKDYHQQTQQQNQTNQTWVPGFWTGLTAGGLAAHFLRNRSAPTNNPPPPPQQQQQETRRPYDWERPAATTRWFTGGGSTGTGRTMNWDRGEGTSSGLGEMRRSTGYGQTTVR